MTLGCFPLSQPHVVIRTMDLNVKLFSGAKTSKTGTTWAVSIFFLVATTVALLALHLMKLMTYISNTLQYMTGLSLKPQPPLLREKQNRQMTRDLKMYLKKEHLTCCLGTKRQREARSAICGENDPYWLDINHRSEKWLVQEEECWAMGLSSSQPLREKDGSGARVEK